MKTHALAGDIDRQRELGWRDFDPEDFCHRCGCPNLPSWCVASDLWNRAVEALGLTVVTILCPQCFVEGYEKATGLSPTWVLTVDPETVP